MEATWTGTSIECRATNSLPKSTAARLRPGPAHVQSAQWEPKSRIEPEMPLAVDFGVPPREIAKMNLIHD
jgi:hypothetical protein